MYLLGEAPTQLTLPPPMAVPVPPMRNTRVTDTRALPYRYVCRIVARSYDKSGFSVGSGILIGPQHVLTCAHVIFPLEAPSTKEIIVCPAQNGPEQSGMQFRADGWAISPAWRSFNCWTAGEDFGVIRLERPTPQGAMPLRPVDPARLNRTAVNLAGYPSDKESKARHMYESRGQFSGAVRITGCNQQTLRGVTEAPTANTQLLMHELDSAKSQSGGPIWFDDMTLVAIHAGIIGNTHKKAIFLNDRVQARIRDLMRGLPPLPPRRR